MDGSDKRVGRRFREVRAAKGLSLRAAAELAGYSKSQLSRIERGEQPVDSRQTLEAFAHAYRVAPSDLVGQPVPPTDSREAAGHSAVEDLRAALRDIELGAVTLESVGGLREIAELRHDVRLTTALSDAYRYDDLGAALPGLLGRVWAHADRIDEVRTLLIECLHSALSMAKGLGYRDIAWSVAGHLRRAAEATDDPAWLAMADYWRADTMPGSGSRKRALDVVTRAADALTPGAGPTGEACGMLRLSAALQSAASGAVDAVPDHLDEAADIARHTGDGTFARMDFGPHNVAVWRVALAVEVGDIERVPSLARAVDVDTLPLGRRAWFLMDLGRGQAARRGDKSQAIATLRHAESLAPQLFHANPFAREAVADLMLRVRRDAGGRELRGMAHRMGLGV